MIKKKGIINFSIVLGLLAILLFCSAASAAQELKVSTSRYSVFNPWQINANYSFDLSGKFTAFALFLDNGLPVSGQDITFKIYANGTLKTTLNNLTNQKGLASVSYNTIGEFTDRNDTDYGTWIITAYLTDIPSVAGSTDMNLEGWANTNTTTCGTRGFCHRLTIIAPGSTYNKTGGNFPHSPYTGGYGNDTTFMEGAHYRTTHSSNVYRGCYICHPGYSVNKTGNYGSTNDVHKNRTCDFCHGNWTYIKANVTDPIPGGQGVPKIPSCYDCHPIYNSNTSQISTLADLLPGPAVNVTGVNISVYSYNYDTKVPLTAHNGTESVPCVVCHGPAHNNSKPDPAPANTNTITEASQCISCHGEKHGIGTLSCTDCHSQNAHIIQQAVILPHTSTGTCARCHPGFPDSFVLPATNSCKLCHSTYADTYGAPNLIGTSMASYTSCNGGTCHGNDITDKLDTLAKHNVSRTFAGIGGYTDTVLLNNQGVLTVTKGTIVTITSRVNDTMRYGGASRVGGAEYYIGTDPGQGKGTPMLAADGYYNALGANWESVTATINTSSLSNSTNTIYVRGRDIGNQWSATKNATLLVQSFGYINGTVNVTGGAALPDATVSTVEGSATTSPDGSYSLRVITGTYTVTVSKQPTHSDNITIGVDVIEGSTRILNADLDERPTGNITGSVTTV